MKKFLIEVEHDANKEACDEAIRVFLNTGSHFMTNADWGCLDGEHKAWIMLEVENKDEAINILPPAFRRKTKLIELTRFELDEQDEIQAIMQEMHNVSHSH